MREKHKKLTKYHTNLLRAFLTLNILVAQSKMPMHKGLKNHTINEADTFWRTGQRKARYY